MWLFVIPWPAAQQAPLCYTISRSLLKFMSIESVMLSNHFIPWHSLLLLSSIFPSIKVFSSESDLLIRWPKYWSFSFSISPSNEYSGLISTSIDWFDFLAVQGTPGVLFSTTVQKHQFLGTDFLMIQCPHPYMTTEKIIALTIWTFVCKWCICSLTCLGLS